MKKLNFITLLMIICLAVSGQQNKKHLSFDDILTWNRITETAIANDGNTIVYKYEPWKGDPTLKVTTNDGKVLSTFPCARDAEITNNSEFVIFTIVPSEDTIRQLKLAKTKQEDMPKNKLGIYHLETNTIDTILNYKSYKIPEKWDGWLAYQIETPVEKDPSASENENKPKKESAENGYKLVLRNLETSEEIEYPFVTDYQLAEESDFITYVSSGDDESLEAGVYRYNLSEQKNTAILKSVGLFKQLTIDKKGQKIAFLADLSESESDKNNYSLYYWKNDGDAREIVSTDNPAIPKNWKISENGSIRIAENTNRIFFGTAPERPGKDTTKLDEEIPPLDIWHWNEPVLQSEQIYNKERDLKKSYLAVYHLDTDKMVQLENEKYTGIRLISQGDADKVLAWSNLPYSVQTMWEGYPYHHDIYLIDIESGNAEMIKKDIRAYPNVSPGGSYVYWYNYMDTTWNTYKIATGKEFQITSPRTIQCADEINDIPNPPSPYGMAGWFENDDALLVYDRYDIWKVDPENRSNPVNLTINGRNEKINYRYIDFDPRETAEKGINPSDPVYLSAHNVITREDGYFTTTWKGKKEPQQLIYGKYQLNRPIKAKNSDVFVYTRETFEEFPNLIASGKNFKNPVTISDVNPQQEEFLWGTKELYNWTSLDGRKLEGLLIKPANFDPNKKYPMIVNFYEKSSQNLYKHHIPEAHRSTVDYHYYSSNGYIIFNPDVYYKEGYPGEDAFNCVMPGVTQLIAEGFVDENAIAAQGHSWGGYQVAYLATRTNLFAAIESGAPVVNMFSAYGGIRNWSGRNRSFQYEHTQSRIGKSIWESPLRYLENSPLFTADKIQTPLLIMHNEDDGAVPFSQGIEFFIALRRLGKKAWLLNYNDADHWPTKVRDKYDFQIRLAQFFDHYLKGQPMPQWMEKGIPAVDKGLDMGLELVE
ncbi:MAG: prolyl oligopeptidase family serine peptidase [Bacteroidales bacterium]|jgi:dipeptidyl aminopeptidase/acylaminoacyl peptidase|nr:prolyl oligopeptidase family serine peptidase [Bacteroidales bacterium]